MNKEMITNEILKDKFPLEKCPFCGTEANWSPVRKSFGEEKEYVVFIECETYTSSEYLQDKCAAAVKGTRWQDDEPMEKILLRFKHSQTLWNRRTLTDSLKDLPAHALIEEIKRRMDLIPSLGIAP